VEINYRFSIFHFSFFIRTLKIKVPLNFVIDDKWEI